MDGLFFLLFLLGGGCWIYYATKVHDGIEKQEREEKLRRDDEEWNRRQEEKARAEEKEQTEFEPLKRQILQENKFFLSVLKTFFSPDHYAKDVSRSISSLKRCMADIETGVFNAEKIVLALGDDASPGAASFLHEAKILLIPSFETLEKEFSAFYFDLWRNSSVTDLLGDNRLFTADSNEYGKVDLKRLHAIQALDKQDVITYLKKAKHISDYSEILKSDPYYKQLFDVSVCYFAVNDKVSTEEFEEAKRLYECAFGHANTSSVFWSALYIKHKIGGENAIIRIVEDWTKNWNSAAKDFSKIGIAFASSFMWMKAYRCEYTVLRAMLDRGIPMSKQAQDRLHALSRGSGEAPAEIEVPSDTHKLHLDAACLTWRKEDYDASFENLKFQNKVLGYSLAVRDKDVDVSLPAGVKIPDILQLAQYTKESFAKEFDDSVLICKADTALHLGGNQENLSGILAVPAQFPHMGVLMYMNQIGKKASIKFYTLFMPVSKDLAEQHQQVLSLYQSLNPVSNMWEKGIEEYMLKSAECLLNGSGQSKQPGSEQQPVF